MVETLDEVKARLNALIEGRRISSREHMQAIVSEGKKLGELLARYR